MSLLLFLAWLAMNAFLINIAIKVGWDYDPGYAGPILIVIVINLTLLLYASQKKSES